MEGPRACRPDELPGLGQLVNRVFRPGGEASMVDEFPTLFNPDNCRHLRVIVDDGRPVSSINYVVRTVVVYGNALTVGSLGAVSTYEEYRGRGLATRLLQDTFSEMRREGVDVVLISGQRGLYRRAGCGIGGHELRFSLDGRPLNGVGDDANMAVRQAEDRDIPSLIALHQTEPARYVRSPWDWEQFLKVCRLVTKGVEPPFGTRRCWLVVRNERLLAYIVLSINRERNPPTGDVVEFGGSRRAAIAALKRLIEKFGLRSVGVRALPEDAEMMDLLGLMDVPFERGLLGGHRLAILHEEVFSRYVPWLTERVGPERAATMHVARDGAEWSLVADGQAVRVGGFEALNETLFGDGAEGLTGDSATVGLFREALPLPWLLPGMNYI